MAQIKCEKGQIGPFTVWANENRVTSYNSNQKKYEFEQVCLKGKHNKEGITTNHMEVKTFSFSKRGWLYPWKRENPAVTSHRFDALFVAYTIEKYLEHITKLGVYQEGIEKLFIKKPFITEVIPGGLPNAFFSDRDYILIFGAERNVCSLGADGDVIIHELSHLLTYSSNPLLGIHYSDTEGRAMHETISDAIAAIYYKNPVVGESVAVCMDAAKELSPQNGLRRLDPQQGTLIYGEESHDRTELYAPFLWFTFVGLTNMLVSKGLSKKAAKTKAQSIMLILVSNMPKFLPFEPQRQDFARALYNSLFELRNRPDYKEKDSFDVKQFVELAKTEARIRRIVRSSEEDENTFKLLPLVKTQKEVLSKYDIGKTSLRRSFSRAGHTFYEQYYEGVAVRGNGIRFIKTSGGYFVIGKVWKPKEENKTEEPISPQKAWAIATSAKAGKEAMAILKPQLRAKTVSQKEYAFIMNGLTALSGAKVDRPERVYISKKENLQYEFNVKGVATIYVDSIDGSIVLARQRHY